jgi:hypothetical protein
MRPLGRSALAAALGLSILTACRPPHRGSTPRPTLDPGQCWSEPLTPEHSTLDGCDPQGEIDRAAEPNGRLAYAVDQADTGPGQKPFEGSLGGSDDVDIFVVHDFDLPFTSINPLSRTTQRTKLVFDADPGSQMCAFFSCTTGVTSRPDVHGCDDGDVVAVVDAAVDAGDDAGVDAGDDGSVDGGSSSSVFPSHLQEGMLGCCRKGSGSLVVGITCDNTAPALNGFVTVESIGDGECNQKYAVSMSLVD